MHPIDRLAQLRNEMAVLRAEQTRIRKAILHGDVAMRGEHHYAKVVPAVVLHPNPSNHKDAHPSQDPQPSQDASTARTNDGRYTLQPGVDFSVNVVR